MHAENSLGFQMRQTDALMTDLLFRILSQLNKNQTNNFPKLSIKHVLFAYVGAESPLREWKGFWLLSFLTYHQIPHSRGLGGRWCKISEIVSTRSSFSKYFFSKCSVDL